MPPLQVWLLGEDGKRCSNSQTDPSDVTLTITGARGDLIHTCASSFIDICRGACMLTDGTLVSLNSLYKQPSNSKLAQLSFATKFAALCAAVTDGVMVSQVPTRAL